MMDVIDKAFFLRMGGNSEKKYVEKVGTLFSGLLVRANYFESSPGMLSGICLKLASLKHSKGYIIDPVTYVYGLNPEREGSVRSWQKVDEDKAEEILRASFRIRKDKPIPSNWIRKISNPTEKQKYKVEIYGIMKAYRKLSDKFFHNDLANEVGKREIRPVDFCQNKNIDDFVKRVIEYQNTAISSRYDATKYEEFKSGIPEPMIIFSPYFMITNPEQLKLMTKVWMSFDSQHKLTNGAAIVPCSIKYLKDNIEVLIKALARTKIKYIFIWIDGFAEEDATKENLQLYIKFIFKLNLEGKKVINSYAGGLSPFLFPFGLSGMVNNPWYGMQKAFEPIKGGLPTAQYYIPTRHVRTQVLESYELLLKNGIGSTRDNFIKDVCGCPICKDGIRSGIKDMIMYYMELGPAKTGYDGIERRFPTSKSLERCAYHFIFSRLIEYRWALKAKKEDAIQRLSSEVTKWRNGGKHLKIWEDVLKELSKV